MRILYRILFGVEERKLSQTTGYFCLERQDLKVIQFKAEELENLL